MCLKVITIDFLVVTALKITANIYLSLVWIEMYSKTNKQKLFMSKLDFFSIYIQHQIFYPDIRTETSVSWLIKVDVCKH